MERGLTVRIGCLLSILSELALFLVRQAEDRPPFVRISILSSYNHAKAMRVTVGP